MIAEWGVFALILALLFSLLLVVVPLFGLFLNRSGLNQIASRYVYGQCLFVVIAYICLTVCFLMDDFSVYYVLSHSSLTLPWCYKLCAVWGGHEGSMLLWVLILSGWMLAVSLLSRSLTEAFRVRVLVVLGALSFGLILFLLMTSNPFLRQFQITQSQGLDLNPLLQDIGFLFHPPMLYMGYVGFSVAFSFAIAALWIGEIQSSWAKWTRPWTLAAWCCLTLGITLGSWWAYRELGWGGWWFWDPVENASFMPWLVGTALLHSLMVSEQRHQGLAWTLLLSITVFSLSLVGTFLVRSGVLTSVHAFAVDPERGLYILIFLALIIGGSLTLFSVRAQRVQSHNATTRLMLTPVSRESFLWLNNVFLTALMCTVLMGTVYPLLIDGLGLGKLSVGAPYFNTVFVPLVMPLLLLMGFGIHVRWQRDDAMRLLKALSPVMIMSIGGAAAVSLSLQQRINAMIWFGLVLAFWVLFSTGLAAVHRMKQRGVLQFGQAFLGMLVAHVGVAVSVIGVSMSSGYGLQDDVKIEPGKPVKWAGYAFEWVRETALTGSNYHGTRVELMVKNANGVRFVYPEKRLYNVGKMPMTEAAIDVTPFRDLYVALGEPLDKQAWSLRLYYKPCVRWIWAGGFLMCFGGVLALADRRYWHRFRVAS